MPDEIKSEFKVEVVTLGPITKHLNADTLSITSVNGYPVIFRTGDFQEGGRAVYIPVDSLVPVSRPEFEFLRSGDKSHSRIKARKLRGIFSAGLLIRDNELTAPYEPGDDVADVLGVLKYISPEELRAEAHESRQQHARNARLEKVKLPVYGLSSLRKYEDSLLPDEEVVITEKIHGCNARYVYTKGRLYVGSHKVMRGCSRSRWSEFLAKVSLRARAFLGMANPKHTPDGGADIWWEIAEKYNLKERLSKFPDMALYGEIYGERCQDLTYDSPVGRKFRTFDVLDLKTGKFLDWDDYYAFVNAIGLRVEDMVPALRLARWNAETEAWAKQLADTGKSTLNPEQIIEGVVVKPVHERYDFTGRVALKYAGEGYLLRAG